MQRRKVKPRPCPNCGEGVVLAEGKILAHLTPRKTMCPLGGRRWPRAHRVPPRQERLL